MMMVDLNSAFSPRRDVPWDGSIPARLGAWLPLTLRLPRRRLLVALALLFGDVVAALLATSIAYLVVGSPKGLVVARIHLSDLPLLVACCFVLGLYLNYGLAPWERLRLRALAIVLFFGVKLLSYSLSASMLDALRFAAAQAALLLLSGFYIEVLVRRALAEADLWGAPTLIVDSGLSARAICKLLAQQPELGLRPVGLVGTPAMEDDEPTGPLSVPILTETSDLFQLGALVEVAVLTAPHHRDTLHALYAGNLPLPRALLVGDAEGLQSLWQQPPALVRHLVTDLARDCHLPQYLWLKRTLDLAIAALAAILVLPVIGALVIAVKIIDPGPALYVQNRIGRNGRVFAMFKIRSMYIGAEQRLQQHLADNPAARAEWELYFKLRDDPRVLAVIGSFIRRYSLDELPQLWNVIRGEMSLVGPRPFPAYHLKSFDDEFQNVRANVTPGMTGLWQVSTRSNGDLEVQKAQDLFYINNRSIWLDLYILLQTVPAVFSGSGAR